MQFLAHRANFPGAATALTQYYTRLRDRVQGPFSFEKLRSLVGRGIITKAHDVSEDQTHWERATSIPGLFDTTINRRAPMSSAAVVQPRVEDDVYQVQPVDDDAPDDEQAEWYYTTGDAELGPVSLAQLRQLVSYGMLATTDFVWREGMENWVESAAIDGIHPRENFSAGYAVDRAAPATSAGTAPMAVASFVCGLLGATLFAFIGSILAIAFGHVAMRQINSSGGSLGGRGMALTGLILGYVIVIAGLLTGVVALFVVLLTDRVGT